MHSGWPTPFIPARIGVPALLDIVRGGEALGVVRFERGERCLRYWDRNQHCFLRPHLVVGNIQQFSQEAEVIASCSIMPRSTALA